MNQSKAGAIIIEGHVQGLSNTRSLGEAGIPVYVVDKTNCIARYSKFCKKFFFCPDFISDDFVRFLIELAQKESIKGWVLIPSNDHAVLTISRNKEELSDYYKIITPGIDIINNIYDKSRLLEIASKINIPIPVTQYFSAASDLIREDLKFPVLTKGRNGLSFYKIFGKKALLADTEKELRKQLTVINNKYSIKETFTQELIPFIGTNKTLSFTAFCINGVIKTHWTGEKVREHPIQFGTATYARSTICKEVYELSVDLLKQLQYTGVCEIEYIYDPRDRNYKLIEINARTWLWVGLARYCGVDYAKIIYDYLNENEIMYPENYQAGICWINHITDFTFSFISIIKGEAWHKRISINFSE